MRFIIDAQLPPALAIWLVARGYYAEHVFDVWRGSASDHEIWHYAATNQSIIVSKDADFAQRHMWDASGPVVLWVRLPNTRKRQLLQAFHTAFPQIIAALQAGETLVELI